jgi:hypothetical protein
MSPNENCHKSNYNSVNSYSDNERSPCSKSDNTTDWPQKKDYIKLDGNSKNEPRINKIIGQLVASCPSQTPLIKELCSCFEEEFRRSHQRDKSSMSM